MSAHKHRFIIPVEWETLYGDYDYPRRGLDSYTVKGEGGIIGGRVTRLMCDCGKEKER